MPNGPNEFLDCSDYSNAESELDKLATKRAIGWMRRFRARIATDIENWSHWIGGDRTVPIEHDIVECMIQNTIGLLAQHVWEMPLFDFVSDKEIAAEHEPEYARLRCALEAIEETAQKRQSRYGAGQLLMDIKQIAGLALTNQPLTPPRPIGD